MIRLPAEWEPQDAIILTWPHSNTDWAALLDEAEHTYYLVAQAILQYCHLIILAPHTKGSALSDNLTRQAPHRKHSFTIITCRSDDTWARDYGPICIEDHQHDTRNKIVYGFTFNGWGNKFSATQDNAITASLHAKGYFNGVYRDEPFVLEGGAIESDGAGTLLTTSACLLNPNRNPHLRKTHIEKKLMDTLGAEKILWLESGYLAGDDTDSHIDTLARLCPNNCILYQQCDQADDEHFGALQQMHRQLMGFSTSKGEAFRLIPLPWPSPKYDQHGQRLPATYANFLITNGAVLVPTYQDEKDEQALAQVQKAFPDRTVVGIDCRVLIQQHGSLHCITMQIPRGFFAWPSA